MMPQKPNVSHSQICHHFIACQILKLINSVTRISSYTSCIRNLQNSLVLLKRFQFSVLCSIFLQLWLQMFLLSPNFSTLFDACQIIFLPYPVKPSRSIFLLASTHRLTQPSKDRISPTSQQSREVLPLVSSQEKSCCQSAVTCFTNIILVNTQTDYLVSVDSFRLGSKVPIAKIA